ncbi:MAG: hypothetical protein E7043_04290 [Lentisphaerae bacterium]|nr:hypothetical protein [Lentisphaerota bacterium]
MFSGIGRNQALTGPVTTSTPAGASIRETLPRCAVIRIVPCGKGNEPETYSRSPVSGATDILLPPELFCRSRDRARRTLLLFRMMD